MQPQRIGFRLTLELSSIPSTSHDNGTKKRRRQEVLRTAGQEKLGARGNRCENRCEVILSGDGSNPKWGHRVYRGAPINKRTAKRLAHLTASLSIALLALLMGVTTAGAQRQTAATVSVRDFYFEPSQVIVEPGTTVRWVNEGTTQHTVFATSPAGAFRSGTLHPGESFTHTFPQRFPKASPDSPTKPGTYEYLCEIHPSMRASVTFSESSGKAPTQKEIPAQEHKDTPTQQPPAVPRGEEVPTQESEDTTVQQPPPVPRTGGIDPLLLIGLLVVVAAVGVLGWAVSRRSS
jgi:plastocyanin